MSVPRPTRRACLFATVAVLATGLLTSCGTAHPAPAALAARIATVAPAPASPAPPLDPVPAAPTPGPAQLQTARPAGADRIDVDKAWTNATATSGGQLLVSARSSDPSAHLFAYRADGRLIGEVQNGRGQRYGGTVFPWQATDPGAITVRSSSGGSATVPTTPWRPEN